MRHLILDDVPEPEVEEVWDGARGEYVFEATFPSGAKFQVIRATSGPFVGDWEIRGAKGCIGDGFLSAEDAVDWLTDPERRDW